MAQDDEETTSVAHRHLSDNAHFSASKTSRAPPAYSPPRPSRPLKPILEEEEEHLKRDLRLMSERRAALTRGRSTRLFMSPERGRRAVSMPL